MSTMMPVTVECIVCKTKSEQTVLTSTNSFGLPDLDLRPAPMRRHTMARWVQECPNCGYVAASLDSATEIDGDFLKLKEYVTCSGINFKSALARTFYKQYLIKLLEKDWNGAFSAALYAAWECDDTADGDNAALCRRLAVEQAEKLTDDSPDFKLQKLDLLRRAGEFEQALSQYGDLSFEDERYQKVLRFQLEKCRQGDVGRYTMFDVDMQD